MLAPLLAVALVVLTILALLLAGVVAAIVTGVALLNLLVLSIGLRSRHEQPPKQAEERWRPSSFRRPPALPLTDELNAESEPGASLGTDAGALERPDPITVRRR